MSDCQNTYRKALQGKAPKYYDVIRYQHYAACWNALRATPTGWWLDMTFDLFPEAVNILDVIHKIMETDRIHDNVVWIDSRGYWTIVI